MKIVGMIGKKGGEYWATCAKCGREQIIPVALSTAGKITVVEAKKCACEER